MPRNIEVDLARYDDLKAELKALYRLHTEHEALIYKTPSQYASDVEKKKLDMVKAEIARKEHELEFLEKVLPPPPLAQEDDWLLNPTSNEKVFNQEQWLKRQKEAREKSRKMGRSFDPE